MQRAFSLIITIINWVNVYRIV